MSNSYCKLQAKLQVAAQFSRPSILQRGKAKSEQEAGDRTSERERSPSEGSAACGATASASIWQNAKRAFYAAAGNCAAS